MFKASRMHFPGELSPHVDCIFDMTALLTYKYSQGSYTRCCTRHWANMNLFSAHSPAPTHKAGTVLLMMLPGTVSQAASSRSQRQQVAEPEFRPSPACAFNFSTLLPC